MKIAIVCDWLVTIGGAEKFLAILLECFPSADLYAVIDFLAPEDRFYTHAKKAKTTFIQHLPFAKKYYRQYLPFMPLAIEQLNLSGYDLIISSTHAVAKGVITGPDQVHISYIHSPMRYAWDLQHQYLAQTGLDRKWMGYLARYLLHKMRLWDLRSAQGVDHFIANSNFIARRVKKVYRRSAEVIYPPVDTQGFIPGKGVKENFYLTASRLVPYKRIDLIVEAFANMPDKHLIVIGDGPEARRIKEKATANVTLLGYQATSILINYLQRARAFIFAAEEDFGLLPVEAQATGTPVIALNRGGTRETVRDISNTNPTGILFADQNVRDICLAVQTFEANNEIFTMANCVSNAEQFNSKQFKARITQFVNLKLAEAQAST